MIRISILVALLSLAAQPQGDALPEPRRTTVHPQHPSQGFIYGRVTTEEGRTHQGRLRWGGDEEAFWSEFFNGQKEGNPWADLVSRDQLRRPRTVEVFGFELGEVTSRITLGRPWMARFGDIDRIDTRRREIAVTLKSGSVVILDRFASDDLADGLTIWDDRGRVLEIDEWSIRSIEFLETPGLPDAPGRLFGSVSTTRGDYQGFVQWNREQGVGTDVLHGMSEGREVQVPFDSIASVERGAGDSGVLTLIDGRRLTLEGTRPNGLAERGLYVNDLRYGRVLVSWEAFQRIDLSIRETGPGYGAFPKGNPLSGTVSTKDGEKLKGRLVYDLDESESTETLDARAGGVHFSIPFGLIAAIEPGDPAGAVVSLHSGERIQFEASGDLDEDIGGVMVFEEQAARPHYVRWSDVGQIVFDRPIAMYP